MESPIQSHRTITSFEDLYVKRGSLGEGCFGCVYHCLNKKTKKECAVKLIPVGNSEEEFRRVVSEVEILASLDHPNIVRFQGATQIRDIVYLEMELLHGGSLKSVLNRRKLEEREAATMMQGVLQAVSYLHARNIYHQDLKPENILLGEIDRFDTVKLTDFGLSAKLEGSDVVHKLTDLSGTVVFMAPEQGTRFFYSKAVDIWSCGIVLYMVLAGKHPLYEEEDTVETYQEKLKNPAWTFPEDFNPLAKSLFLKMTAMEPIERYSVHQALHHPFISRSSTEIPRTTLEQLIEYADTEKLRRILFTAFVLSTVLVQGGVGVKDAAIEEAKPQIERVAPRKSMDSIKKGAITTQKKSATFSHLQIPTRSTDKKEALTPTRIKPSDTGKSKNSRSK